MSVQETSYSQPVDQSSGVSQRRGRLAAAWQRLAVVGVGGLALAAALLMRQGISGPEIGVATTSPAPAAVAPAARPIGDLDMAIVGTGSVYDERAVVPYASARPAGAGSSSQPAIVPYASTQPMAALPADSPDTPIAGAGSGFDVRDIVEYPSPPQAAPSTSLELGIDLPAGANPEELPAGLADYVRR